MWLIVRSGPDAGTAVEVTGEEFVLGRQRGSDLVLRDARSSRRHATLEPLEDGRVRLRDLGSANGTLVDAEPVQERILEGGEEIRIGQVLIDVRRERPEPAAAHEVPTYSMVGRLVERGSRRARRAAVAAGAAAGLLAVVVVLVAAGAFSGEEDSPADRVPAVVERLTPATVLVETLRGGSRAGTGSGWVLDAEAGLIVTAAHVVNQGDEFRVAQERAELVASAPCEDLALLRVRGARGLRAAPLGSDASLRAGETVVALGYPEAATAGETVGSTTGVVSAPRAAFRDPAPDVPAYPQVVQTDTALNPGNSGGPLADLDGRVVGVNAAARTSGAGGRPLQNVNYAIAIDRVKRVLGDLREGRSLGWLGASFGYPAEEDLLAERLPPGLRITGAVAGTPAAEARLAERPGVLAAVNGVALRPTLASWCDVVAGLPTGEEVELTFARPGGTRTEQVRVPLA